MKASALTPHPLNPRVHGDGQRTALNALLAEVGMARSLLAYEDPQTDLTLIDGHLRREELGDYEVTVEILDVTPEEAEKLLLSMDPLAALADFDADRLTQLQGMVHSDSDVLNALWANVGKASREVEQLLRTKATEKPPVEQTLPENYLIVIECADEPDQRDKLAWLKQQGVECRAVTS